MVDTAFGMIKSHSSPKECIEKHSKEYTVEAHRRYISSGTWGIVLYTIREVVSDEVHRIVYEPSRTIINSAADKIIRTNDIPRQFLNDAYSLSLFFKTMESLSIADEIILGGKPWI